MSGGGGGGTGARRSPTAREGPPAQLGGAEASSERARVIISHRLGEPALFAITLSTVVSAIFFSLGVVAGEALGLTPLVYLLAAVFFAVTMATYVEGELAPHRAGRGLDVRRYAFDEFWSFVAGWAILLDYLIVMAIGAVVISGYLTVFWSELDEGVLPEVIAGGALLFVAMSNIRGLSAHRIGSVLRLSVLSILVLIVVSLIGFASTGTRARSAARSSSARRRAGRTSSSPAASRRDRDRRRGGLRARRRDPRRAPWPRRVVLATIGVTVVLSLLVSVAALMATPVVEDRTALGGPYIEAPVLAIVSSYEPGVVLDVERYVVGATGAALLLVAMNGQMLGLARLAYSLATNRQIPSAVGRLHRRRGTPYVTIWLAALIAFALAILTISTSSPASSPSAR